MKKTGSGVMFKKEKPPAGMSNRRFIALLAAVLILGGSLSGFLFLRNYNYDLKKAFDAREETTEPVTEETGFENITEKRSNLLLYCTSEEDDSIEFLCMMKLAVPENGVCLFGISPDETVLVDGKSGTPEEFYRTGGEPALMKSVAALVGITPDHYVGSTDAMFRLIINDHGGVTVPVNEQISYKGGDFRLVLAKGTPLMKGETFLNYLRWKNAEGGGAKAQAEVLRLVIESFLTEENAEKDTMSKLFSVLISELTTDISIVNFTNSADWLAAMMKSGATVYQNASSAAEYLAAFEKVEDGSAEG